MSTTNLAANRVHPTAELVRHRKGEHVWDMEMTDDDLTSLYVLLTDRLRDEGVRCVHGKPQPGSREYAETSFLDKMVRLLQRVDAARHGRAGWRESSNRRALR